jgi:hypothetical protein
LFEQLCHCWQRLRQPYLPELSLVQLQLTRSDERDVTATARSSTKVDPQETLTRRPQKLGNGLPNNRTDVQNSQNGSVSKPT